MGDSTQQIERTIRTYIDAYQFRNKYSSAYDKWSIAEELLWASDSEQQLTTIGHYCREALQEFSEVLINQFDLQDDYPVQKTQLPGFEQCWTRKNQTLGVQSMNS